jgi:AcrR family transcriptional regulator
MSQRPGLRERKNARTREAIERAALELALEQGFDHTTVDEIAERADVSPRTVFTRYPTKDAIVFGGLADSNAALVEALEQGDGDFVDRLLQFVSLRAEAARERMALEALSLRAMLSDPSLRRTLRGQLDEAEGLVARRLADELGLPADEPGTRVFAASVSGLFLASMDHVLSNPDTADPLQGNESGVEVVRAGLAALEARARR